MQVSAVGAGLLLGSALCIILPEGFEAAMEVRARLQQGQQQQERKHEQMQEYAPWQHMPAPASSIRQQ
jgi:hypothetical protein